MFVDVVTWCFRVLRICVGVLHDVTVLATSRRSRVGTDSVDQRAPRRDLLTLPRDGNDGIDRRFGSALRFAAAGLLVASRYPSNAGRRSQDR
jgi:hypothetical protein